MEGKEAIHWQGRPLSLVHLADVLRLTGQDSYLVGEEEVPAIVLAAAGQRIAFLVDDLLNEEEIVVKTLGK